MAIYGITPDQKTEFNYVDVAHFMQTYLAALEYERAGTPPKPVSNIKVMLARFLS